MAPKTPGNSNGTPPETPPDGAAAQPETLETLAARLDHLDTTLHSQLGILTEVRAQLVQVDSKQNGAAALMQSTAEQVHRIADMIEHYQPVIEQAAAFVSNPVGSYLAKMKKGRARGTETPE